MKNLIVSFLPEKDIKEVIDSWNPHWMVIGGTANLEAKTITLVYGDMTIKVVPFSRFKANATAKPNFKKFKIGDWGHTIVLGKYEAGADSL